LQRVSGCGKKLLAMQIWTVSPTTQVSLNYATLYVLSAPNQISFEKLCSLRKPNMKFKVVTKKMAVVVGLWKKMNKVDLVPNYVS